MHSDIDTLERIEILRDLRLGAFDCLVGINLLREGLDIPECGFVAILDADKEGFLRSETSLIQTIGRAARNVDGKVILYADQVTGSMERAMAETARRREKQQAWNEANGITSESVKSRIADILDSVYEKDHVRPDISGFAESGAMIGNNLKTHLEHLETQDAEAAADLDFETAARLRDEIKRLREMELAISDDPLAREVEVQSPVSGREKGRHNKGRALHRAVDDGGWCGGGKSLFAKPTLDNMGPGTDMPTPGGAIPRSLFKKQSHDEAHGADYRLPDDARASAAPQEFARRDDRAPHGKAGRRRKAVQAAGPAGVLRQPGRGGRRPADQSRACRHRLL